MWCRVVYDVGNLSVFLVCYVAVGVLVRWKYCFFYAMWHKIYLGTNNYTIRRFSAIDILWSLFLPPRVSILIRVPVKKRP